MSLRYTLCTVQVGTLGEGAHFAPAGEPGDWQELSADFQGPWPVTIPLPRVFVSPFLDNSFHGGSAPVCVVTEVTPEGFTFSARNTSPSAGETAFTWVAICDTIENDLQGVPLTHSVPDISVGTASPRSFSPTRAFGDLQVWPTPERFVNGAAADPFSVELSSVMLTGTNLNVTANHVAAVGFVDRPRFDGLAVLAARNSDIVGGMCGFFWGSFAQSTVFDVRKREPSIELGEAVSFFERSGHAGDWQFKDVYFADAFLTAPVVLTTSFSVTQRVAIVSLAQNVTPFGFTLALRNADIIAGRAGSAWVAIGWPAS
jgi:hypothetical protein